MPSALFPGHRGSHWNCKLAVQASLLALSLWDPPVSPFQCWGYRYKQLHPAFFFFLMQMLGIGTWVCILPEQVVLYIEPSPQPFDHNSCDNKFRIRILMISLKYKESQTNKQNPQTKTATTSFILRLPIALKIILWLS